MTWVIYMGSHLETREKEVRSTGELRAIQEDGMFEGYLTVWGSVDDYNSTFQRGSFKKTIQERGSKVKIFYNHEHLIGSSVELREDDYGVFGKGKLNLDVDKAKEAYTFMKDGTLDGLSFGFRTIKEGFLNGVRQIKEVQLFEFGPVAFPANDLAAITDIRNSSFDSRGSAMIKVLNNAIAKKVTDSVSKSDVISKMATAAGISPGTVNQILSGKINIPPDERLQGFASALGVSLKSLKSAAIKDDSRAIDFNESLDDLSLEKEKHLLMDALWQTLSDVWWDKDNTQENIIGKIDKSLADFHAAYLDFSSRWVQRFWVNSESRGSPFDNSLATAFAQHLIEQRKTIQDIAAESKFTVAELTELRSGRLIKNRENLGDISPEIVKAHQEQRNKAVESLCSELRESFSDSEKTRILALLKPVESRQSEPDPFSETLNYFKNEQAIGEQ